MRIEKNYDFLKDFRDNWLFYIDWAPKSEKRSFSIAFNGFSDDEKKELQSRIPSDDKNNESQSNCINRNILSMTKYYNYQQDRLNEIGIYYNFSVKDNQIIIQLPKVLKDYFNEVINFANILVNFPEKTNSERKEILKKMDEIVETFNKLLESEEFENIIGKMKKEISIK